ncbi:MinD-like ATPase involved in chromosome partitioning or flagellar assembly [Microbacterium sp. SORGH_AS 1204]|nr:MinD-like ATPase involved in chromosome partitioning or flagellar assembly [Microbacterium sp. SORGH_AS_1204]
MTTQSEDDVASEKEDDSPRAAEGSAEGEDRSSAAAAPATGPATAPPVADSEPAAAPATGSVPTTAPATGSVPAEAPATGFVPAEAPATGSVPAAAPATGSVPTAGSVPAAESVSETGPVPSTRAERAATAAIGTIPLTRRGAHQADEAARAAEEAARVDRAHAMERVRTPAAEVTLTSKRIGQIDDTRESSDLLTADRLLDPRQIAKPEPEGLWQQLVYSVSGHRINLGDGRKARERKALDRRIGSPLTGGARFVPVLSRKGGVGKTTVTSLLGMALADARDDRIIAVDANPDRGTLADRVGSANGRTVRDLVRSHEEMVGFNDVSSVVARDATRLDVLASDADPRVSEAFSDDDYRRVADVASHYYSIVLTDTGTGIVHSVMGATLELADTIVVVAGLSVDEARLASETLTWLETNGYAARVRDAVVVLNNSRPGAPLVRESELEAHFRSRVRTVIRMPYDARIAAGSAIAFRDLDASTRQAARELAAAVVEGLRSPAAAA